MPAQGTDERYHCSFTIVSVISNTTNVASVISLISHSSPENNVH